VVEHLPSKIEALSSTPVPPEKNLKKTVGMKSKEIVPLLIGVFQKRTHLLRIRDGELRMRVLPQGTSKPYLSEIRQAQEDKYCRILFT
jgi:hypothetical protein